MNDKQIAIMWEGLDDLLKRNNWYKKGNLESVIKIAIEEGRKPDVKRLSLHQVIHISFLDPQFSQKIEAARSVFEEFFNEYF